MITPSHAVPLLNLITLYLRGLWPRNIKRSSLSQSTDFEFEMLIASTIYISNSENKMAVKE